jgi:undecaprenyl diphosphate synthase
MQSIKDKIILAQLPKHVAIIMDGNGRWAQEQGQDRLFGHYQGVISVRKVVEAATEIGIQYLTLYAFSSENWKRPNDEVDTLMSLISETLLLEAEEIFSKGLRLHVIGDIEKLPELVREQMLQLVNITKDNTHGNLILALSYGSQSEILNAVKKISSKVKSGELNEEEITEEVFENHLYTRDLPPVDLLIRTSGEVRISNFLLWQIAYAELQFLDILWPDFGKENFFQCVYDFQNKERRFGKTSEQLDENI